MKPGFSRLPTSLSVPTDSNAALGPADAGFASEDGEVGEAAALGWLGDGEKLEGASGQRAQLYDSWQHTDKKI